MDRSKQEQAQLDAIPSYDANKEQKRQEYLSRQ